MDPNSCCRWTTRGFLPLGDSCERLASQSPHCRESKMAFRLPAAAVISSRHESCWRAMARQASKACSDGVLRP